MTYMIVSARGFSNEEFLIKTSNPARIADRYNNDENQPNAYAKILETTDERVVQALEQADFYAVDYPPTMD